MSPCKWRQMDVVSVNVFTETQILTHNKQQWQGKPPFKRKKHWAAPQPLKKDPNLSTAKEKSGIEDHNKGPSPPHLLLYQQGPVAVVHLPLHLLIHSLSCFPSIPSGFYLGRTLEHHQLLLFCQAAAQRGALGLAQITQLNWLWAHFLTGLLRSCSFSENPTNKVKQHIYFYYLLGQLKSGYLVVIWKSHLWEPNLDPLWGGKGKEMINMQHSSQQLQPVQTPTLHLVL